MSRASLFILPLIAGVGMYLLVIIVLPELGQLLALIIALLTGWTIRWLLGRLESSS
jgi:hypothetical protein